MTRCTADVMTHRFAFESEAWDRETWHCIDCGAVAYNAQERDLPLATEEECETAEFPVCPTRLPLKAMPPREQYSDPSEPCPTCGGTGCRCVCGAEPDLTGETTAQYAKRMLTT